jgi:hypothetical protein
MLSLTTPSGFIIEYREYLTFGEKRAIDKMYRSHMKMRMENDAASEMTAEPMLIAEDMAMNFLITKITMGDQVIIADFRKTMESWKEEDGQAVVTAINEVTARQKKAPISSSEPSSTAPASP